MAEIGYHTDLKQLKNRSYLTQNNDFLDDARRFLFTRGGYNPRDLEDPDFVYDKYLEHFRSQNVNEVSAARDLYYAKTASDTEVEGLGRLMETFDTMPSEFGGKAVLDYAEGIVTAPSTYAGMFSFGSAKAGAIAANAGIKQGIKSLVKYKTKEKGKRLFSKEIVDDVTQKTLSRQALQSGLYGAGIEGAAGLGTVSLQEQTRVEAIEGKDEVDPFAIGVGFAVGAGAGGLLSGFSGGKRFATSRAAAFDLNKNVVKYKKALKEIHKKEVAPILGDPTNTLNKSANTIKSKLVGDKLALEETVPKQLKKGKQLRKTKLRRFEEMEIENIAVAASRINKMLPDIKAIKGKEDKIERLASRITRAISDDPDFIDSIDNILVKHKVDFEDLAPLWVEEISRSGRILGGISALSRRLQSSKGAVADSYASTKAALNELDNNLLASGYSSISNRARIELEKQNPKFGRTMAKNLNKARVGIMTTQITTTVRNTSNGYLRNFFYALDNLNEGLYNIGYSGLTGRVWNHKMALQDQMTLKNPKTKKLFTKKEAELELKAQAKNMVKLGQAQLKTFGSSLHMKDLKFGMLSREADALFKILGDSTFNFTPQVARLLRGMADVAEVKNVESGVLGLAQKLNTLNTLSDNMFKRAVFTRELNKFIMAKPLGSKGQYKNLSEVISAGRFDLVPDEYVSRAMTEAWEFTYQTSDFGGRKGFANTMFREFVKTRESASGEILKSSIVPFPRYMVNQFRFMHSHMPLLGMVNAGGILNKSPVKSAGKKLSTGELRSTAGLAINPETLAKQTTGLMILGSFIGLRHHYGDETTGPFEYVVAGEKYDARAALGPFTMFAWVADLLYRTKWFDTVMPSFVGTSDDKGNVGILQGIDDKEVYNNLILSLRDKPVDWKEGAIAALGGQGRKGNQLFLIDQFSELLQGRADKESLEQASAKYLANFVNTAFIPAGMFKDIMATTDTPWSEQENFINLPDNAEIPWFLVFYQNAMRSFPEAVVDGYGKDGKLGLQSSTRRGGVKKRNAIVKQLTGFTPMEKQTPVERELSRLGFDYGDFTPKRIRGDTKRTNLSKFYMAEFVEDEIAKIIETNDYQSLDTNQQRIKLVRELLSTYKSQARLKAMLDVDSDSQEELLLVLKRRYDNLPKNKRIFLETLYQSHVDKINRQNGEPKEYVKIDNIDAYSFIFDEID